MEEDRYLINQTDLSGQLTCDNRWHLIWQTKRKTSPWKTTYTHPYPFQLKSRYSTYTRARYRCTGQGIVRGRMIYRYQYREEYIVDTQQQHAVGYGAIKAHKTITISTDVRVVSQWENVFGYSGTGRFV